MALARARASVGRMQDAPPKRCLIVGYDASATAERALSWALHRAGADGCVVLVHADEDAARGRALSELPFLERGDVYDVPCAVEVRGGPPAEVLMEVAAEHDADQIVVGTRRTGRLSGAGRSVCSELLRRSPCPVVVVP
jgi:nucleotide-binding universal stress UspA family protein